MSQCPNAARGTDTEPGLSIQTSKAFQVQE